MPEGIYKVTLPSGFSASSGTLRSMNLLFFTRAKAENLITFSYFDVSPSGYRYPTTAPNGFVNISAPNTFASVLFIDPKMSSAIAIDNLIGKNFYCTIYMPTYSGFYRVKNPAKYDGDFKNVIYRSHWEMQVFRWCDQNDQVLKWSSEEVVVPYYYPLDRKYHRYFVDVKYTTKDGTYLVEIKPKSQTVPPKKPSRQTKRFLEESRTYVKNQCKWKAATEYAEDRGWKFVIWTEDTIKSLGIRILT